MPPLEARKKIRPPAEQAHGFVLIANKQNPTSVCAQSISLALQCKELGVSPAILGEAIVSTPSKIHALAVAANHIHKQIFGDEIPPVEDDVMLKFVKQNFEAARYFVTLPDRLLKVLLIASPMYHFNTKPGFDPRGVVDDEIEYQKFVQRMINNTLGAIPAETKTSVFFKDSIVLGS